MTIADKKVPPKQEVSQKVMTFISQHPSGYLFSAAEVCTWIRGKFVFGIEPPRPSPTTVTRLIRQHADKVGRGVYKVREAK